jgi:hypothetical protein
MKAKADELGAYLGNFRKRWNVETTERDQFREFQSRALYTVMNVLESDLVSRPELSYEYAKIIGRPPDLFTLRLPGQSIDETRVWKVLEDPFLRPSEFMFHLESLFHLSFNGDVLMQLAAGLREDIKTSGAPVVLAHSHDKYIFYRKGARLLDEHVVNEDLEWLSDYPKALAAFENALVQSSNPSKQRETLDSLRVSLENFLRQLLGNRKSLENNKDTLLKWMDDHGTNVETRDMVRQLFQFYCRYQNEHVKHGDGWKPAEVDFILYLTATFIHLLAELGS